MYKQQAAFLNCFPHIRYFQNSWVRESMKEPTHILIQIRLILYLNFLTRANEYSQCCRPLFLVSICTRKGDILILSTHVALFTGTIIACFSIFVISPPEINHSTLKKGLTLGVLLCLGLNGLMVPSFIDNFL